jgi:hypothetical protein
MDANPWINRLQINLNTRYQHPGVLKGPRDNLASYI